MNPHPCCQCQVVIGDLAARVDDLSTRLTVRIDDFYTEIAHLRRVVVDLEAAVGRAA